MKKNVNLAITKGVCILASPLFIAGNNEGAKKTVSDILNAFGWDAEDMGGAEAARAIEPLSILWCILGFTKNEWTGHAFKLLKK